MKSGSMIAAINSSEISGTPRTHSMMAVENQRTSFNSLDRPSASMIASG